MRRPISLLALALVALAGCAQQTSVPDYGPRPVQELEQWDIRIGARSLGRLVLLEIDDPRGRVRFYRAENERGQWLGYIDTSGRVYQRVPFSMVEVFRGIHTMEKGLALLYEEDGTFGIVPLDSEGQPKEASAPIESNR